MKFNIRNHFPDALRPRIWSFLCDGYVEAKEKELGRDYYCKMLETVLPAKIARDIEKDVLRTITHEKEFNPSYKHSLYASLTKVLHAYIVHDPELGYVQGMNFITAGILFGLAPSNYSNLCFSFGKRFYPRNQGGKGLKNFERMAFWIMMYIFEELNWREVFGQNFAKLRALYGSFEARILNSSIARAFDTLKENKIKIFDIFSPWFYSLFINKFPLVESSRIIDIFLLETESALIDLLIRLLSFSKKEIFSIKDDPGTLYKFIQDDMVEYVLLSTDGLFSNEFKI